MKEAEEGRRRERGEGGFEHGRDTFAKEVYTNYYDN